MPPASRYGCAFGCGRMFTKDFMLANEEGEYTMCLFCQLQGSLGNDSERNSGLQSNLASLKRENTGLIEEVQLLKRELGLLKRQHYGMHISTSSRPTPSHHSTPPLQVPFPRRQFAPTAPPPSPPNFAPSAPPLPPPTPYTVNFPSLPSPRPHPTNPSAVLRSQPNKTKEKNPIPLRNRFEILATNDIDSDALESSVNETEINVFGDSLVRSLGKELTSLRSKNKACVYVSPGADIARITNSIKNCNIANKDSCLVVCAGSNDAFNKRAASEEIIKKYKQLLAAMKDKSNRCFVTSIIPRKTANKYELSRAIGINSRLEVMCSDAGVAFIDTWDAYIGNRSYFAKDKVHFNSKGTNKLADIYSTLISYHIQSGNFRKD